MSADLDDFGRFGKETWKDSLPLQSSSSSTISHETEETAVGAWPEDVNISFVASSNLTIPGMGDQPESCGVWYPQEFCGECGEPHMAASSCQTRSCPECWLQWTAEGSGRIARRLAAYRQAQSDGLDRRLVHTVSSPEVGEVRTLQEFQEMKRDGYQLAKEMGVRGGVAVAHGYRVKEEIKEAFRILQELDDVDDEALDHGIWKWIREKAHDWRKHVYWSPHVHIIGVSRDVKETGSETKDGWVHTRLDTFGRFELQDRDTYNEMIGRARYCLSHATFDPAQSRQAVRWFGSLAPASFSPEEALSPEELDTIESMTEEVRYGDSDDEEDECDECGAHDLHPIWEARQALQQQKWCEQIGREKQRRLLVAVDWATGQLEPPPGLARPTSEDEARETFDVLLEMRHGKN